MNENVKARITIIVYTGIMVLLGAMIGYPVGMNAMSNIQKEVECKSKYAHKPINETPVNCLKYFNITTKE